MAQYEAGGKAHSSPERLAARIEAIALRSPIFLILAAALAFGPAITGSFHLDDYSILVDPAYTAANGVLDLIRPSHVRPLTNVTLWANYQMHGDSPLGFHLVNLLLHLVAVWFARDALNLLLPPSAALLAVTVFALHPLQTEPVAYIYARTTLLCGLFCWAAIANWARGLHWTAVLLAGLALLSKEEAVALPVFFAILHLTFSRNRREWRPLGVMFALALATGLRGLVATAQLQGSGAGLDVATSPFDYALAQGYVVVRYLRLLIFPFGLNFDPDLAISPSMGALCWCAILGLAVYLFRTKPKVGFWFTSGLVFLAPTSSFLPIADLAADRRMYLASACFAAAVALLLPAISTTHVVAVGVLLASLSFARSWVFRTEESLWRDTLAASPAKVRPRIQLARAVPPAEALPLLADLSSAAASSERGRVYLELGRPADALREFGVALAAAPGDPQALSNRGTALAALHQTDAAQRDFQRALERDPCLYPALLNLRHLGLPLPDVRTCRFNQRQRESLGLR